MSKLTFQDPERNHIYHLICRQMCGDSGSNACRTESHVDNCQKYVAFKKLAEYEETGLEPADIKRLSKFYEDTGIKLSEIKNLLELKELKDETNTGGLKGKDLIEIIKNRNLEDFEIEVSFTDGYNKFPNIRTFKVTELNDIGYSSKQVSFDIEEK